MSELSIKHGKGFLVERDGLMVAYFVDNKDAELFASAQALQEKITHQDINLAHLQQLYDTSGARCGDYLLKRDEARKQRDDLVAAFKNFMSTCYVADSEPGDWEAAEAAILAAEGGGK